MGLDETIDRVLNKTTPKINRKPIRDFLNYCLAKGISHARIKKYLYILCRISELIDKSFDKSDKDDVINLMAKIVDMNYSEWTKKDYKVGTKIFYKWLRQTEDYPPEVRWIKTGMRNHKNILPEQLLTEQEVQQMVDATPSPRNKAIIWTLWSSGCRAQELLTLKIKNVEFGEYAPILFLNGKTGMRRIIIGDKNNYLKTWFDYHTDNKNPEACLWLSNKNASFSYSNLNNLLRVIARNCGIKKPCNPHHYRHSRCSMFAGFMTEAQMNVYFGWVQGSDMPRTYVHMSGKQIDNTILKHLGLTKDKKRDKAKGELMEIMIKEILGDKEFRESMLDRIQKKYDVSKIINQD